MRQLEKENALLWSQCEQQKQQEFFSLSHWIHDFSVLAAKILLGPSPPRVAYISSWFCALYEYSGVQSPGFQYIAELLLPLVCYRVMKIQSSFI